MDRFELLKYVTDEVEKGNEHTVSGFSELIAEHGIESNMHVGKHNEIEGFFDDNTHVAEWLLGQFRQIIEEKSWFVMNSLINQSYSFLETLSAESE